MFAEVVRAFVFLVSGLIMYWDTAKWSLIDVTEMYTTCRQLNCFTPILEQSEYHSCARKKLRFICLNYTIKSVSAIMCKC